MLNCWTRGSAPSLPLSTRDLFTRYKTSKTNPAYSQWDILYEGAELCGAWRTTFFDFTTSLTASKDDLYEFIVKGYLLDRKLEEWSQELSTEWGYSIRVFNRHSAPKWLWPLLEGPWIPRRIHHYPSILIEHKWRDWLLLRLVLNHALLQSIDLLDSGDGAMPYNWPQGSEHIERREVEQTLINVVDETLESCLAMFTRSLYTKPEAKSIEEVCSLRGVMMISTLSSSYLCLSQAPFQGLDVDGRKQWARSALLFLHTHLGIAKAEAFLDDKLGQVPLQLWGVPY